MTFRLPAQPVQDHAATKNFDSIAGEIDAMEDRLGLLETTGTLPTGVAGGDLTGTYPSPTIGTGKVTNAKVSGTAAIAYTKLNLATSIVNADISGSAAIAYSKLALTAGIINGDINASAAIAYTKLALSGSVVNADIATAAAIAYTKLNLAASIVNADVSSSAAIAYSKLALSSSIVAGDIAGSLKPSGTAVAGTEALRALGTSSSTAAAGNDSRLTDSRAPNGSAGGDLTGTYPNPTIGSGKVTSTAILDGTILNADINASAAIALTKLATDPLARANHTGTQLASTVSDFDTQVRTSTLNQMTAPTADLSINTHKLTNVTDPTAAQDATTLAYVQGKVFPQRGLVDYATKAALASYTGGGTSTITASANGALSVDGGSPTVGQRILVKDEGVGGVGHLQNGIYSVTNAGSAGTKWVLTRVTDLDAADEFAAGVQAHVQRGTANGDSDWIMKTDPPITVNTTAITFRQASNVSTGVKWVNTATKSPLTISSPGSLTAEGDGLSAVGGRILLTGQASHPQNGIYIWNGASTAMTRAPDFDSSSEILDGTIVYVGGGVYAQRMFQLQGAASPGTLVVGTDDIFFYDSFQFGDPASPQNPATRNYVEVFNGTYTTSLPGSPVDGQQCFYAADATNGIIWHLRYRSTPGKWEFLGGAPLFAEVTTDESTASTSYAALATAGPSITVPLAGDYIVELGSHSYNVTGAATLSHSYAIGATGAVDADAIQATGQAANYIFPGIRARTKTSVAASTALVSKYKTSAGTAHFLYRWMRVTPIKVS